MFILGNKGMHMTQDILLEEVPENNILPEKRSTCTGLEITITQLYKKIVALQHQAEMKANIKKSIRDCIQKRKEKKDMGSLLSIFEISF